MASNQVLRLGLCLHLVLASWSAVVAIDSTDRMILNELKGRMDNFESQLKFIKEHQAVIEKALTHNVGAYFDSCRSLPPEEPSNLYMIRPPRGITLPFVAYCDQDTLGGGWTVIHRRYNGAVSFDREWSEYKEGFGEPDEEHWIGLKKIHGITQSGDHELLVVLKDFDGTIKTALYDGFEVANEQNEFQLTLGRYVSGEAGDSLAKSNQTQFSTKDRDNDRYPQDSCARIYLSGWWFHSCMDSNLNGLYDRYDTTHRTMNWYTFRRDFHALKEATMMLREKSKN